MSILFLRVFWALSLAALGGLVPQLGARLEALGITGTQLGLLLALLPAGRLLSAPVWGWLADRLQIGGALVRLGALLALAGAVALWKAEDARQAGAGLALLAVGRTPLGPLVDAFTVAALKTAGRDSREYGKTRAWGSLGFLLAAQVSGWVAAAGGDPLAVGVVLTAACTLLTVGFPIRGGGRPAPVLPALRALADQPGFWPLLGFGACQALTINVYDTFFSIHVHALGLPATVTSYAVFTGVALEIAVMAAGRPILARIGSQNALIIAAAAAIPRWLLTARLQDPGALVAVQTLHGVSFALFWIGGVEEITRRSASSGVTASAQSLWATATYGFGALLGAVFAGTVREDLGTPAVFYACAGVSTVALTLALRSRTGRS